MLQAFHFEKPKCTRNLILEFTKKESLMNSPRILLFGRNGQIGWHLCRTLASLGDVTAVDYPDVDFSSADSIRIAMRSLRPTVVVNAAAYTAVDEAESRSDLAMAINGIAPGIIAEEAKRQSSIVIHYSTDYVFDGTKPDHYVESDPPNPLSVYGRSKLAGDLAIQAAGCDHLIFRTSWVYGSRGKNFLLTMLRLAQQRPELRIINDQIGAPTASDFIAQATTAVLAQILSPGASKRIEGCSGIYNLTNSGETSWFGFAEALLNLAGAKMGLNVPRLLPITTSEYPLPAKRPSNSRLSTRKVQDTFGILIPTWQDSLSHVMERVVEQGLPA